MAAEYRRKTSKLEHPRIKFLICGIFGTVSEHAFVTTYQESTYVKSPERNARHAEVETGRNLMAVHLPICANVAAPRYRAATLQTRKRTASQDGCALAGRILPPVIVDIIEHHKHVGVEVARKRA